MQLALHSFFLKMAGWYFFSLAQGSHAFCFAGWAMGCWEGISWGEGRVGYKPSLNGGSSAPWLGFLGQVTESRSFRGAFHKNLLNGNNNNNNICWMGHGDESRNRADRSHCMARSPHLRFFIFTSFDRRQAVLPVHSAACESLFCRAHPGYFIPIKGFTNIY